ncbi:MAG: 16S rRNA (cytosine(967)-C(5))-methyltransferase [Lachnospiraceae bacterium]|nr:16S rRNA (cytosine(967)-C(5))-methyltransferase [Lachnospiraceae bacterium]
MTTDVNLRELALDALLAVTRDRAYSHTVVRGMMEKYQYLGKQERSFLKRICEGTLENMIWIDYVINQFSSVKVNKMKPVIRCILRNAVYELKFMDAIPASATCNEAVKLAQKRGFRNLKGFVNGVLRNVSRNLDGVSLPDREESPIAYLSVRYSMPEWIIRMWEEAYPLKQIESFLQAFLANAPTAVRVNPFKAAKEALKEELAAEGVTVRDVDGVAGALYLEEYDFLGKLPSFREGKFYVQDISSMQVALCARPKAGDYILDVCAAPGGKSIHMAELLWEAEKQRLYSQGTDGVEAEGQEAVSRKADGVEAGGQELAGCSLHGMVEARDLTELKVSMIQENIACCGLPNIRAVRADARVLDKTQIEKADIVVADLPCSGLGVLGRKADIKYRVTLEDCRALCALQQEILHTVQQYVKTQGQLVYSTCTISPMENEGNVRWFLQEHPEFCLEEQRQILPAEGRNDGFFLARFRKG